MEIPGIVDLQVSGYIGVDFSSSELTEKDFIRACRELLQAGTTAFLPTIITSPKEVFKRNLAIMASALQVEEFHGRLLGLHIEGPFISPQDGARGAHNAEWVSKPDINYLNKLIDWADNKVKLITIAAEAEGAEELTEYAVSRGIAVALGHQMANIQQLNALAKAGAKALTHLGNGCPAVLPRHENPIWAGLDNDELTATIITDGHHLPPAVIKTFIRAKGVSRCIVVSDSSALAGLPPGRYNVLGNDAILEESGLLYNPNTGYLAGSSSTMLQCMNHLASLRLLSVDELLMVGFFNPLKLIGLTAADVAAQQNVRFDESQNMFCLKQ